MNKSLQIQLSTLMFFEFFIWGAWYTTIAVYMSNSGMEDLTHWPFTMNPIATIVAPFFVGFIADRFFPTEKVLGVLHLLGALFLVLAPQFTGSPFLFITMILLHCLCYMPTVSLASSLAFHQIQDQEKQFPVIRVFGTIGWIVAGLVISFGLGAFVASGIKPEATPLPLYLAAGAGIILGLFSFSLPHTPPPARGEKASAASILGLNALRQLGSPSFYVFAASSLLISIPLAAYYNFTQLYLGAAGFENIAATQSIGQMSEIVFMLLMPVLFVRLGVKWMLGVGMMAWVVRYALFALGAPGAVTWMILVGVALHGICYDFFFVTGQIYVDKIATPAVRGQAQGFILMITFGVGMLIGAQVAGTVYNGFLEEREVLSLPAWQEFWWIPSVFAGVVLLFFMALFKDRRAAPKTSVQGASPAT